MRKRRGIGNYQNGRQFLCTGRECHQSTDPQYVIARVGLFDVVHGCVDLNLGI